MSTTAFSEAYLDTLLRTERLSKAELASYQADLVHRFIAHANANIPFYRDRLDVNAVPGTEAWLALPTINRATLNDHGIALTTDRLPDGHGTQEQTSSGGSTGAPVVSSLSGLESYGRVAITYRTFATHGLDQSLPMFQIRPKSYAANWTDALVYRKWGCPWRPEAELGDRVFVDFTIPVTEQIDSLESRAPAYVNTLPSSLLRLVLEARRTGRRPHLPAMLTVAEYLAPEVARAAADTFNGRVVDIVTSSEAGPIAIQCAESDAYHIQSERLLVEILDDSGRPVAPGKVGELVVTPFYNYAMPLVRYRSGDYVVAGSDCPCGRCLPTIAAFAGRKEHRFTFPDGSSRLPAIDRVAISEALGHDRWQFVQTEVANAELRHEPATGPHDRGHLHDLAAAPLGEGWRVTLNETPSVPPTKAGKRHFTVNAVA